MADDIAPAPPADSAPAPSDASTTAPTLLTQGEPPAPADPAAPPADSKPADPPAEAKPAIPEKYDFTTAKLPEGIKLSPELVDAIAPVLKKHGLTQEAANELVETHAAATQKLMAAQQKQEEADFTKWMADRAKANTDAIKQEWGHEFDGNLKMAQRGLARLFPGTEGKRLLDETGLGNHPEFLKAFLAVGKMIQEDKPPNGATSPSARKSTAEVLYGGSSSN